MKNKVLLSFMVLFGTGSFAQDSLDCPVEASFTYEIEDGYLNLTNTSTGVIGAFYSWSADGLSSYDEDASFSTAFFEAEENVCLTVWDSIEDCSDTYCELIAFEVVDEDSVFTDSTDCLVEASFTYEISGGYLNLTNTTSGAEYPVYSWWVDGLSSWEENPSFSTAEFEDEEEICLEVYDSLADCSDTYCLTIYMGDDSTWTDSTMSVITYSETEVNLYPNPVNDQLNVSFTSLYQPAQVLLYNQVGEFVRTERVNAGTNLHQMDVNQLSKGMYILILQSEDVTIPPKQFKFVKQ